MTQHSNHVLAAQHPGHARTGGAALIVVLALMTSLAFLAFFFFFYISTERENAGAFAASPRTITEEDFFQYALRQILLGAPPEAPRSALQSGKHSIIPNMIGNLDAYGRPTDVSPFNGTGLTVLPDIDADNNGVPDSGIFFLDYDRSGIVNAADDGNNDGNFDGSAFGFTLNWSAAANGDANNPDKLFLPTIDYQPDAGYTYPDINSMFLGHYSWVDVDPAPATRNMRLVWIPSFHRPQYLPRDAAMMSTFYTNTVAADGFEKRVLRPHRQHKSEDGVTNRFVFAADDAATAALIGEFPLDLTTFPANDTNGDGVAFGAGTWTKNPTTVVPNDYEFDADPDGDGVNEAIFIDLDYPITQVPGDPSRSFVPIFAVTILDADGLINLNTAGNLNRLKTPRITSEGHYIYPGDVANAEVFADPAGNPVLISTSNLGLSRSEINPARALFAQNGVDTLASTGTVTGGDAYTFMFGTATGSFSDVGLANMDFTRILMGATVGAVTTATPGRWGDEQNLAPAGGFTTSATTFPTPPALLPAPGVPTPVGANTVSDLTIRTGDDDADYNAPQTALDDRPANPGLFFGGGRTYQDPDLQVNRVSLSIPPYVHPLDFTGAAGAAQLDFASAPATGYRVDQATQMSLGRDNSTNQYAINFLKYDPFWEFGGTLSAYGIRPWAMGGDSVDSSGILNPPYEWTQFLPTGFVGLQAPNSWLLDEESESTVESRLRDYAHDALFPLTEMAFLHVKDADFATAIGAPSRLEDLAPISFDGTALSSAPAPLDVVPMSHDVRKQFTTESYDRWELTAAPFRHLDPSSVISGDNDIDYTAPATRPWEYTLNETYTANAGNGNQVHQIFEFPTIIEVTGDGRRNVTDLFDIRQPVRREVRDWIGTVTDRVANLSGRQFLQQRLNLNRFLDYHPRDVDPATGQPVLRFRNLTPHPVFKDDEDNDGAAEPAIDWASDADLSRDYTQIQVVNGRVISVPDFFSAGTDYRAKHLQEWWARYDRQRMARDIYTLMYFTCGPDGFDPTDFSTAATFPDVNANLIPDFIEEMAQFAVNAVDAMDRDNVMTVFVYDADLSDGWQTDITDTTDILDNPTATGTVSFVRGVEAADLTLSEVLWMAVRENTAPTDDDLDATLFDDSAGDHQYLWVELRNATPFDISLRSKSYRVRSRNGTTNTDLGLVEFQTNPVTKVGDPHTALVVGAGENFVIGTHDGRSKVRGGASDTEPRAATLRVDLDWNNDTSFDTEYRALIPAAQPTATISRRLEDLDTLSIGPSSHIETPPTGGAATEAFPLPVCDLDLCHLRDRETAERFLWDDTTSDDNPTMPTTLPRTPPEPELSDGTTSLGFLLPADSTATGVTSMDVLLERRVNPYTHGKIQNDPLELLSWVELDQFAGLSVLTNEINLTDTNASVTPDDFFDATGTSGYLTTVVSREANEPLSGTAARYQTAAPANRLYKHTLGGPTQTDAGVNEGAIVVNYETLRHQTNSLMTATGTTLWQPHFDRDFSSVFELLSIPLFGPDQLRTGSALTGNTGIANTTNRLSSVGKAQERFLVPDPDAPWPVADPDPANNNRWYRLLEYVTVDTTQDQALRNQYPFARSAGAINLNTIRQTGPDLQLGILAALIDDRYHLDSQSGTGDFTHFDLLDRVEAARDWGYQFQVARDGLDPSSFVTFGVSVPLPGAVGSRPFRPMNFISGVPDAGAQDLQQTLLRDLPFATPISATNLAENGLQEPGGSASDTTGRRQLFEARTFADVGTENVDYHTRHRLLSKISNLSTQRSNVFYCWIEVRFFEAVSEVSTVDPNVTITQIGAELPAATISSQRAFFVLDRSLLEDAYDPATRTFDYKKFITYRLDLSP